MSRASTFQLPVEREQESSGKTDSRKKQSVVAKRRNVEKAKRIVAKLTNRVFSEFHLIRAPAHRRICRIIKCDE
jgi:hypothetical protein